MPIKPSRRNRFTWTDADVTFAFPEQTPAMGALTDEQHTILWELEKVSNQSSFNDAMLNVAHYMADHPTDTLIPEAVRRAEERIKHAT